MSTTVNNNIFNDFDYHGKVPWVLLLTTFAVWGIIKALSNILGGWRSHSVTTTGGAVPAAAPVAPAYDAEGGVAPPGARVAPAAGGVAVAPMDRYHRSTKSVTDGLQTLLWLMLIPTLINQVWGFHHHSSRNLIISIFAIGMVWAFLRSIARPLHRFLDLLLLPLVIMAIAASAKAINHHWD